MGKPKGKTTVAMVTTEAGLVEVRGSAEAVAKHLEFVDAHANCGAAEEREPRTLHRDAGTGRLVSEEYAAANPGTTVKETR